MDPITYHIIYEQELRRELAKQNLDEIYIPIPSEGPGKFIALGVIIAFIITSLSAEIKEAKKKEFPKCEKLSGLDADICMAKATVKMLEKQVSVIKQKMTICNKSKDKVKCKKHANKMLDKIKKRLEKAKKRLKKLEKEKTERKKYD